MAVINILDKHTAELIAAGEVVERPASVVKELVENAIDAGATSITVHIERGGIALMQIADNGSGIEHEYIKTAFIRHATSKIKTQDDLEKIGTLGFRGEALASIASVAHVELLTKTSDDEFAALYKISGGDECSIEAAARPVGTTITVCDLFYNTPARLKFLKKDASEASYINEVVVCQALAHPNIAFKFFKDNKLQFQSLGDGNLKSTAYNVLSKDFAKELVCVTTNDGAYKVNGLITLPQNSRASRGMQYFYINGRYVKNTTMSAALEAAYKGMVMSSKFPGCILFLEMPPELVDVNVHPAKTQVRFAREREVFSAVYAAVKSALMQASSQEVYTRNSDVTPQYVQGESASAEKQVLPQSTPVQTQGSQLNSENTVVSTQQLQSTQDKEPFTEQTKETLQDIDTAQSMLSNAEEPQQHKLDVSARKFTPVTAKPATVFVDDIEPIPVKFTDDMGETLATDPQVAYKVNHQGEGKIFAFETGAQGAESKTAIDEESGALIYLQNDTTNFSENTDSSANESDEINQLGLFEEQDKEVQKELKYVGEVFNTYIITQVGDEICIIDKHAAHERLLYEKLINSHKSVSSQMLLCPITVQLSASEKDALLQNEELLANNGVEVDDFGGNSVILRAVPSDIEQNDLENFVVELSNKLSINHKNAVSEKSQWVMHSICCRAAIKGGDRNHNKELFKLAQDILYGEIPPYCPHGRPVIIKMTKKEVEKQFGRQG